MQVKVWSSLAAVMVALVVIVKVVGLVVVLPSVPAVVDQEPKLEPVVVVAVMVYCSLSLRVTVSPLVVTV